MYSMTNFMTKSLEESPYNADLKERKDRIDMEEMTTEEMQRFLNHEAERGSTEQEALKALMDILGIKFPKMEKEKTE